MTRLIQDIPHAKALEALKRGNERFAAGLRSAETLVGHLRLKDLARNGQHPFAIILTCSDSRVPAEMVFDCGLGDLFVIRVAGNVVQPSQIASIEYAAAVLGTPLCVVMGHSQCGAVKAAVESELGRADRLSPNIDALIDLIRPAVRACIDEARDGALIEHALLGASVRANVRHTASEILSRSKLLSTRAAAGEFGVAQALFDLETGKVDFLADAALTTSHVSEPARIVHARS